MRHATHRNLSTCCYAQQHIMDLKHPSHGLRNTYSVHGTFHLITVCILISLLLGNHLKHVPCSPNACHVSVMRTLLNAFNNLRALCPLFYTHTQQLCSTLQYNMHVHFIILSAKSGLLLCAWLQSHPHAPCVYSLTLKECKWRSVNVCSFWPWQNAMQHLKERPVNIKKCDCSCSCVILYQSSYAQEMHQSPQSKLSKDNWP